MKAPGLYKSAWKTCNFVITIRGLKPLPFSRELQDRLTGWATLQVKARPEEGLKNSNSILSELHGSLWSWSLIIKTSLLAECLIKNKEGGKLSMFYKDVLHYLTLGKDLGVSGDFFFFFFFESRVTASKIGCYGRGVRATTLTLREEVH